MNEPDAPPAPTAGRGLLLIVSSPSGAGKTTLTRLLLEQDRNVHLSVSVTTRPRRPSEVEGVHYHFISELEFSRRREAGDLLEWAKVHGHYYGTPRAPVEAALAAGRDVLFDIDWQGTRQVYATMRADIVSVFLLPPSAAELRLRLERRAQDSAEVIRRRLRNARVEIGHWTEYDHALINDDLQTSYDALRAIIAAERARRARRATLAPFVHDLKRDLERLAGDEPDSM